MNEAVQHVGSPGETGEDGDEEGGDEKDLILWREAEFNMAISKEADGDDRWNGQRNGGKRRAKEEVYGALDPIVEGRADS